MPTVGSTGSAARVPARAERSIGEAGGSALDRVHAAARDAATSTAAKTGTRRDRGRRRLTGRHWSGPPRAGSPPSGGPARGYDWRVRTDRGQARERGTHGARGTPRLRHGGRGGG